MTDPKYLEPITETQMPRFMDRPGPLEGLPAGEGIHVGAAFVVALLGALAALTIGAGVLQWI